MRAFIFIFILLFSSLISGDGFEVGCSFFDCEYIKTEHLDPIFYVPEQHNVLPIQRYLPMSSPGAQAKCKLEDRVSPRRGGVY